MIAPLRSEIRLLDIICSLFRYQGYGARLEQELIKYFGVKHALLTHSGRTGLYFLLKALPHKKVYLPAYNCWAVTEAALYANKEIEYVDISLDDYNMDVAKLRDALVADSIILATHQFGIPCDIEAILELARERNCIVLEDNAPALGAQIRGKRTGSFGAASIISFDYSKTVVCGKGGAILFADEALYHDVKALHEREVVHPPVLMSLKFMLVALAYSYATHKQLYPCVYALFKRIRGANKSVPSYNPTELNPSYWYDFDEKRAKLAYAGWKRLEHTISARKAITDFYDQHIAGNEKLSSSVIRHDATAAFLKFPIRLKGFDRQHFYDRCRKQGLDVAFLFPFHYRNADNPCPNAATAAAEAMSLPVYGALTDRDLGTVRRAIDDANNYLALPRPTTGAEYVETRRLFCFTLHYYWMDTEAFRRSGKLISLLRTHEELPSKEYLLRIGYKTFLVDLSRTREEIYDSFDYTRAICPIKKALKSGITVRVAETPAEKKRYSDFYKEFVEHPQRKNKILVLQERELSNLTILYAVSAEGDYLGGMGLLPSADGRYLLAKYSATLHGFCAQDLLVWHAIQYAKDAGYSWFDLSWMQPTEDKNSSQYRLYQFKKKFGGNLVDFYSYVRFRGPLIILGLLFRLVLDAFFKGDINTLALCLKRLKVFK